MQAVAFATHLCTALLCVLSLLVFLAVFRQVRHEEREGRRWRL